MQDSIDKDVRLFIPQKYKFLLFGGNFLFSKRLYEIAKRELKIKRIDFNNQIESSDRIKGLIKYYNFDTFIFTSEILLKLDEEDFIKFKKVISSLKDLSNLKFIFISITKPLNPTPPNYYTRIQGIKNILDLKQDMFYEFSSFITYVDSNIEKNPLNVLSSNSVTSLSLLKNDVHLSDDIINDIIYNRKGTGNFSFNNSNVSKTFKEVCNYAQTQSKCSLNIIYRKKPYEIVNNRSVADWRFELGASLTSVIPNEIKDNLDLIIPVPETGRYYAQGLASKLKKPYIEAFYKKAEIGRSFDISNVERRQEFIDSKLGLISNLVDNKNVGIIDEAIFTGSTLKTVSNLLKSTNVNKVYYFIPSPECKFKCDYNMQPDRKLISESFSPDELSDYFNIEGVYFQKLSTFSDLMYPSGYNVCCFFK